MSDNRLSNRNAAIQEMLTDGDKIQNFYRFVAQNPHISLHDACQIIISRPNASVCFAFEEWNAIGRRVTKGKKGIPFYDTDGYKRFAFDANDTHGEERYKRLVYPIKRLLQGLDALNGSEMTKDLRGDYRKIHFGVATYLQENGYLTDDEQRNCLILEGVTYSLYSKTAFPKNNGITMHGMTGDLMDNAQLFKEVCSLTDFLHKEIEEAYVNKQNEVKVIDDVDEETVSDEPIIVSPSEISVEQTETAPQLPPYYKEYLTAQEKYPKAIVLTRLGDFYEMFGESAIKASDMLNLTITGRIFGEERVPMCGIPFHVTDQYIEKLLEQYSVVVLENNKEPIYIQSHAPDYVGDIDTRFPVADDYGVEADEQDEIEEEYDAADYDEYIEDEPEEEKNRPQAKPKQSKPIQSRKRNEKPQMTFFDMLEGKTQEKTPEEQVIDWGIKYGGGTQDNKFRIYEAYKSNPSENDFIALLKKEYGGYYGAFFGDRELKCSGKGVSYAFRYKDHPEDDIVVHLNWKQLAYGIADLIDENEYFSEEQAEEYRYYSAEQHGSDEERIKAIADSSIRRFVERNRCYGERDLFFSRLHADYKFLKDHAREIEQELNSRSELESARIEDDRIYLTFASLKELTSEQIENSSKVDGKASAREDNTDDYTSENTDLNEIGLDQSELGGAKARFRSNINAIKLLKRLDFEKREPTRDEQIILAKYVGWGGLAKAFDEHDESWRSEYAELISTLDSEDYEKARGSVLNAHYTSKTVIDGIYNALTRFGIKGNNRILESAMGTGNFFGYMPKEIRENARLYGVELDNITGKLAQKLYPKANIQIKGFEQTTFADGYFDIVVGNVPFGAYTVYDSDYARQNFYIHDYFLAKSLDKLKPNGVMAVITSTGTMDKINPTVRKYLAERAELLGAIRLPNNAFKQNANTEVVADILFFKKREQRAYVDTENTEWLSTAKTEQGYEINNYFAQHPEMVLGEMVMEHGMYGALDLTVKPDGRNLADALEQAISKLPENFYVTPEYTESAEEERTAVDFNVKPLCYKAQNGRLYMRVGDEMVEQEIPSRPADAYDRICAMIELRDELRYILDIQTEGCSDEKLKAEQKTLNANYDRFVRRYGIINSQTNTRLFKDDGDSALLFACENLSDDKKTATKADIFAKRTIRPYIAAVSTDDCLEALQICKNERGNVDISYIEEITKKDYDTVLAELGNAVFRNPIEVDSDDKYSGFETAEEYLSGKVVEKLATAERYAEVYPNDGYEKNVEALKSVQPEPIKAADIAVRLGASWVDEKFYKQFIYELLDLPLYRPDGIQIYYNPHDSSWRIDKSMYIRGYSYMNVNKVYGTERADAYRLITDCLNLKATTIFDTIEDSDGTRRVLNKAETIAAREKQNSIKEAFKEWVYRDPERREELEKTYNSKFNRIKLPTYDGSYLRFPEMNPAIELKPHQKNAVHRIITGGNTLLHHVVGSGKTFTICAAIMKLRQYGLAKKPMIAVPNHLVQQWASQFRTLYPNAKLLIASKDDLDKDNRQKFVSKVALGDWDAVIIAQSSFAKIPISRERQVNKIREEIARIETTIETAWEEQGMPRGAVKNLEKIKKNREAQLKKLLDDDKKDNVLIFENLGVDYLFVDEAHYYKNKFLFTKMNNVAGISTAASQRASDLELKCEYINELQGGEKGVVFATGTPISNSMTEMYTMQSYLQQQTLQELGITYFDGWAADFGETVTSLEMTPSGQGYKPKTRFSRFTNLPELLTLYRSFADVQTSDMVKLDVPDVDRKVVSLKPSDAVLELADEIAERAERISTDRIPPEIDNMLKVTSDGKKLALDPRCYERSAADEEGSKLNVCADNIAEIWNDTHDMKATQIVFCDLSTPKKAYEDYVYGEDFDVYNDLKYKLVQRGIPSEQIAFIHDANTDDQKQALFDKVNAGTVRVLIGSTEKCGAGTNVQERLIALHHLDTPYRPSDMQQREGRIARQGNTNKEVKIFTYVKERTFDSYSYQILENKQRFISQIDRGDLTVREADDIDETTLTYAEIKAITAANPKIKLKMEVDTEVARLRVLEGQYKKDLFALQDKVRKVYPDEIQRQTLFLEHLREDIATVKAKHSTNPERFSISVAGKVYTDRKEGGLALMNALRSNKTDTAIAEYAGFKISLNPIIFLTAERSVTLSGIGRYSMEIGDSASGLLTRLDNFCKEFPEREERAENKLKQLKNDLAIAEEEVKKPFEYAERLSELIKQQGELNAELDIGKREEIIMDDSKEENIVIGSDEEIARQVPEKRMFRFVRPEQFNEIKEDTFIDREDKIAALEVAVLPDYTIGQKSMHNAGYMWDGMLPLRKRAAKMLLRLGLPVVELRGDDTERAVATIDEVEFGGKLFGIEKPDWNEFIESDRGRAYLTARLLFCQAVSKEVNEEMNYFDARFVDGLSDNNFMEREALERYLRDIEKPDIRLIKPYIKDLLEDYTGRFDGIPLGEYGWELDNVRDDLARFIPDEEISKYAQEITHMEKLREESPKILELHTECKNAIDKAISENFDGMHLGKDFEDALIDKYGMDEINYVLANTVQYYRDDGRISPDNKAWANTIEISEKEDWRYRFTLNTHRAILDGFIDRVRKKQTELLYGNKREEYYTVMKDTANGKDEYTPVYMDAATGEIGTLFKRSFDAEKEIDELIAKVNTATDVPRDYRLVYVTPEELNKKSEAIKKTTLAQSLNGKFLNETKQGYKVINITKDKDERNIAIIYRQTIGDFIVAPRYDTADGTWAQSYYFNSLEAAERERAENYGENPKIYENKEWNKKMPENEQQKWIEITVSQDALIRKYDKASFMRMPTSGKYNGFVYNIYNNRIEEAPRKDGLSELAYTIRLKENDVVLIHMDEEEKQLSATEFKDIVHGTLSKDYARKSDENDKQWTTVSVPQEAILGVYEKRTLFAMPKFADIAGFAFYVPNVFVREDEDSDGERVKISVPDDFRFTAQDKNKENKVELSAYQVFKRMDGTEASDYQSERGVEQATERVPSEDNGWRYVSVDEKAKIAEFGERTMFRMPQGEYSGYCYYIPNKLLRANEEKGTIRVSLPENFVINIQNNQVENEQNRKIGMNSEDFIAQVKGKTVDDYTVFAKPSEAKSDKFMAVEQKLVENVPDEMKAKPNWVIVRTKFNEDKGRLDKFLIDIHTGKMAKSDDPTTWATFDEAREYARHNGGVALAYALDGKDGIACIDLDDCIEENGDMTPFAADLYKKCDGMYCEKSVSGKGLHFFGKTQGMDVRTFSEDGEMEFYRGAHFIAMTGDNMGGSELKSFDEPQIKNIIESKCAKRVPLVGKGVGVEGLSRISDRDVVERAEKGKDGETFKALYEGQDIKNDRSRSDMSLMNKLAFWCNGDKEQMLRIFATSGLYRPEKSDNYYEGTVIKAIRDTVTRFQPKTNTTNTNKPITANNSGKDGK